MKGEGEKPRGRPWQGRLVKPGAGRNHGLSIYHEAAIGQFDGDLCEGQIFQDQPVFHSGLSPDIPAIAPYLL